MKKIFGVMALFLLTIGFASAKVGIGNLYFEGDVVRTVVPPSSMPHEGTAPFFAIMEGAEGQFAVAGAGPGDKDYRGGSWAFNSVEWNVEPYLLTSMEEVLEAEDDGDVTITRESAKDFRCPIQVKGPK